MIFFIKKPPIDSNENLNQQEATYKKTIYRDFNGNEIKVELDKKLQKEFKKRRREEFNMIYERRKHIDLYITDDEKEILLVNKKSLDDEVEEKIAEEEIIKEIWKLPSPQNKRVFMKLINKYSLTKIAKIEGTSIPAIKFSIDKGMESLRKNIKNSKKFKKF